MPTSPHGTGLPGAAAWLLAGTFASNIGNGMHTLAAGALLYQQTGSIAAFGIVVVLEQAVTFLMQVVAGPHVDRGDPRRAAMLAELMRGTAVVALSLLLAARVDHALAIILAMTTIIRCLHSYHRAGTFALTPALMPVGRLAGFNSWFSACQQGGQLVGFGITGVVVAQWGAPAAFLVNGVSFLVSAATLAAIRSPATTFERPAATETGSLWRNVLAGWADFGQLMCRDVRLAGLAIVSTADNVALILFNLILAPLVAERLSADPAWLSLLAGGFAFGAMAASAFVGPITGRAGVSGSVLVGISGQMLVFAGLWWFELPRAMLLLVVLLGVFNTISWTTAVTAVQLEAPAAVRGRLAMARNAVTAAITAPLVPLVAVISQTFSHAAALLLASGVSAAFLLLAAVSLHRSAGDHARAVAPPDAA